jgi:tetratricopeptide (TPR) repeat protein
MKLAVFRNPFSIQAAYQVAGSNRQILHTLVEKCVLTSPYEGHYLMHDIVRQFSLEKLAGHPEAIEASIRQRHSDYFLEWASTWSRIFKSSRQKTLLDNVDTAFEDVKMAWDWATQQKEFTKIGEASEGLFLYYFLRYRFQEGERTCTAALDRIRITPANSERLGLEGWILAWQACFHRLLGNIDLARQLLEKSLETLLRAQANGQDTRLGQALVWREKSWLASNLQETQDYLMRSSTLYQELGEAWRNGEVHAFMGEVANRLGKRVLALEILQQAVAMSQLAGEPRLLARSLTSLAYAHLIFWDQEKGLSIMETAASAYLSIGDAGSLSQAEAITGTSLTLAGRYSEAEVILEGALQKLYQLGDRFYTVHITLYLGGCQGQRGQFTQATLTLQKALELARQDGYQREEIQCLAHLGGLALLQGNANRALELLKHSVDGFRKMKFTGELAMALGGLALAQHLLGEEKPALASLVEALRLTAASHNRLSLLLLPSAIIVLLVDAKKWEQAVEAYAELLTDPIVANSHIFEAFVGNKIGLSRERLSENACSAAKTRRQEGDLFDMLGRLAQEIESWSVVSDINQESIN